MLHKALVETRVFDETILPVKLKKQNKFLVFIINSKKDAFIEYLDFKE